MAESPNFRGLWGESSRAGATDGPAPAEARRGNTEVNGGGGSEGAGRSDDVEKVRQIRRGEVINGFEGV